MGSYEIEIKASAEKQLRQIASQEIPRTHVAISRLRQHPFPAKCEKLRGAKDQYRIRVGVYRIVYTVDKIKRQIIIQRIRHRKDVYRN